MEGIMTRREIEDGTNKKRIEIERERGHINIKPR
jgi:hypothetical protein